MFGGVFPVEKGHWADVDANAVSLAYIPVYGDAGALGHSVIRVKLGIGLS